MEKYHNHIAIIGAGISGLALGCILQEARIPVVIFEKSNEVSNYGAGISISPNGIKILKNLFKLFIVFLCKDQPTVIKTVDKRFNRLGLKSKR